ncbi:hypothetical protein QAD02_017411 [Eretmocerus hayati]|uniref:Uncharacterized protein n=1 Tax=Eretmocerus hayati TaxID=131215 RepID=A0ACC2PGA8_9HYME|nr:hypothetical protein QAD02_017411 [Eretmocerus hayati]
MQSRVLRSILGSGAHKTHKSQVTAAMNRLWGTSRLYNQAYIYRRGAGRGHNQDGQASSVMRSGRGKCKLGVPLVIYVASASQLTTWAKPSTPQSCCSLALGLRTLSHLVCGVHRVQNNPSSIWLRKLDVQAYSPIRASVPRV